MKDSDSDQFILGIDPGSRNAGYALIKVKTQERSFYMSDSGVYQIDPKIDFFKRLCLLSNFFLEYVKDFPPFDLAIESLAYVKNFNSFGKLAQARGAILAALEPKATRVCEYPPNLVKSTVSKYGHSSKQNTRKSLGFYNLSKKFKTSDKYTLSEKNKIYDESDALAIALCHYFYREGRDSRSIRESKSSRIGSSFKGKFL